MFALSGVEANGIVFRNRVKRLEQQGNNTRRVQLSPWAGNSEQLTIQQQQQQQFIKVFPYLYMALPI